MTAPKRLKDMAELAPSIRADLVSAQNPAPYDTQAGLSLFASRIDGLDLTSDSNPFSSDPSAQGLDPVSAGGGASSHSIQVLTTKLAQGSYWGWAATGVATTLIVGSALLAQGFGLVPQQGPSASPLAPINMSPDSASRQEAEPLVATTEAPEPRTFQPPDPVAVSLDALPPQSDPSDVMPASGIGSPTLPGIPPAVAPRGGLEAEVKELRGMRRSLDRDPLSVLSQLDHSVFRGRGQLEQERRALRIEALVRAGRTAEARTQAVGFLEEYPQSPAAPRVACIKDPKSDDCR